MKATKVVRMINLPGERKRNMYFYFLKKLFSATQKKKKFLEVKELQEQRKLWGR